MVLPRMMKIRTMMAEYLKIKGKSMTSTKIKLKSKISTSPGLFGAMCFQALSHKMTMPGFVTMNKHNPDSWTFPFLSKSKPSLISVTMSQAVGARPKISEYAESSRLKLCFACLKWLYINVFTLFMFESVCLLLFKLPTFYHCHPLYWMTSEQIPSLYITTK